MMDFTVLMKDLRDVAEKYTGKTTDLSVNTAAYVDMFTKVTFLLHFIETFWTVP